MAKVEGPNGPTHLGQAILDPFSPVVQPTVDQYIIYIDISLGAWIHNNRNRTAK